MQKALKIPSAEDAFARLSARCALAECCPADMEVKMKRWGMDDHAIASVMERLIRDGFLDETRYCRAFIKDKSAYAHWGKYKIEQALRLKGISSDIYRPLLDLLDCEDEANRLLPLLKSHNRALKARSAYERRGKLIRFAMGRGFEREAITKVLSRLQIPEAEEENMNDDF